MSKDAVRADGSATDPTSQGTGAEAHDEVVLSVEEDRTRLAVQGAGFLAVALVSLFSVVAVWQIASMTGYVALLLLVILALTVAWFTSRAMGRRFSRLLQHTGVVDFGERTMRIYADSDPKKAIVVPYRDIKSYKLIRQGKALRLLLSGDWVSHPSGFHLVDIDRPFMADTLDGLEGQVLDVLRSHHVKQSKK